MTEEREPIYTEEELRMADADLPEASDDPGEGGEEEEKQDIELSTVTEPE